MEVAAPPHRADRRGSVAAPAFGLRANRRQFWLLVLVNAFVGAMVGLERTVLPLLADAEFGVASASAVLSFILTFGLVKAVTNVFAGGLSDRYGRKRVLVAGWLVGLPVPFVLIFAPSWSWIIAANVLLGIHQGLAWSTTIIMKIDLVGPVRRGFAMGLNEFAGYLAIAFTALATGEIASRFSLSPEPFYLGIGIAAVGLALSLVFVRDTMTHVWHEAAVHGATGVAEAKTRTDHASSMGVRELLTRSSWRDSAFSSISQAGLVNNLNDGLAWGLFPLFFAAAGLPLREIGILAFVYPATWGIVQLWTGGLSDRLGRKWLIVAGMIMQGGSLVAMAVARTFVPWIITSVLLGVGTAMVYPTLLAAVGDVAHPSWRGSAVGVYRFWRDTGYAVGAIVAGVLADSFGMSAAITTVGLLTIASGAFVAMRMPETHSASAVSLRR